MYSFATQAYSTYRGLFGWLTWPSYIGSVILAPVVQVILYAILGRFAVGTERAQMIAIGITVQSMASVQINGLAQCYSYEVGGGTLPFLYISRVNRVMNFFSRSVLHFPNGLLMFVLGIMTAWIIVGLDMAAVNWLGCIIGVIVVTMSLGGFGQLLGIFTMLVRDFSYISALASALLIAFAGIILPISLYPIPIQEICKFLPVTNGLVAIRGAFQGEALSIIGGDIIRELFVALMYYALALFGFLLVEKVTRCTGMMDSEN